MKKHVHCFRRFMPLSLSSLLMLMGIFSTQVYAVNSLSDIERYKVIEVPGQKLNHLLNGYLRDLSLMAVKDGHLKPIPFQFDEYDEVGNVFFPDSGVPLVGEIGRLDATDKLLFLFSDAGSKKTSEMISDGTLVAEISLQTEAGEHLYVYVVENSRLRSDTHHVRYSKDLNQVETDFYSITNNPKNALNWDDVQIYSFEGEQDSPMDTMKLRLHSGLFLPFPKIKLDNDNFVARPYDERVGPVRATTQFLVNLYLFKIRMVSFQIQVHYFPKSFSYAARANLPRIQRLALWKPQLLMSLDGNNLEGATIETPLVAEKGLVDGVVSHTELKIMNQGIDYDNTWIRVNTGLNLDVMSFFEYIEPLDIPVKVHLEDSFTEKDRPERFVGQSPNLGYRVTKIPRKGFVGIRVLMFVDELWQSEGGEIARQLRSQPDQMVRVM